MVLLKNILFSILFYLINYVPLTAQISESCNCIVDTLGYASFLQTIEPDEDAIFQFKIHETFAVAYGEIDSTTPIIVQDLIDNHPSVTTIIMHSCPGSQDDDANLAASFLIHNHGYKMYLPYEGWIASGAVDMFLAGTIRVIDATYDPVGVHSWSDGEYDATHYPVGHHFHQLFIDYYIDIGFSQEDAEAFYYFTIHAAPADDIYWMTDTEIDHYKIRTCRYSSNPNYSISENGGVLSADLNNASYQWLDCGNNYSSLNGENNQSFTPLTNGSYAVEITEPECLDTSQCISYNTVRTENMHNDNAFNFSVYPNPITRVFNISLDKAYINIDVQILNLLGNTVYSAKYNNSKNIYLTSNLPKGAYILKVNTNSYSGSKYILAQ